MRGAPHKGLVSAILCTKSLTSRSVPDRPGRFGLEIQIQKRRNPRRCQPITFAGLTKSKGIRQFGQAPERKTQNQRSVLRSPGLGHCLFITASWCRRARFSKANSLKRPGKTRSRKTEDKSLNIQMNIPCVLVESRSLRCRSSFDDP